MVERGESGGGRERPPRGRSVTPRRGALVGTVAFPRPRFEGGKKGTRSTLYPRLQHDPEVTSGVSSFSVLQLPKAAL